MGRLVQQTISQALGHAAGHPDDHVRTLILFKPVELPHPPQDPPLRVLPNGARIHEHDVGFLRRTATISYPSSSRMPSISSPSEMFIWHP